MPKGFYVNLETLTGPKRWRVEYRRTPRKYGQTDWSRSVIEVDPAQTRLELVDTLVHELCHVVMGVQHDETIESVISKFAASVTETLFRAKLIAPEEK